MSRRPVIADLGAVRELSAPALVPGAGAVVHVESRFDDAGRVVSDLCRLDLAAPGAEPTRLTTGHRDTAPVVSPDGRTVFFVRSGGDAEGSSLYRVPVDGGTPEDLTSGLTVTGDIAVAPDGGRVAFCAVVDDERGDPDSVPPPLVVDGPPGHVLDGAGWVGTARVQVFVLDLTGSGAEPARVRFPAHCGSPAFSPDGTTLAVVATTFSDPEVRMRSQVLLVDVAGLLRGADDAVRAPFVAQAVNGPLTWFPDGSRVIAIGTEAVAVDTARLLALDPATGAAEDLNPGLDRGVMGGKPGYPGGAPAFAADGRLYFCVRDQGRSVLHSRGPAGDLRPHDLGAGAVVSGLSVDGDRAVALVSTPSSTPELVHLDLSDQTLTPLTTTLARTLPDVEFLATQERWFTIGDGTRVHGWLLRDPATAGPAPTIIDIHGGPHNAWTGVADTAHLYHQVLAAAGWNVLTLNPRASDGYGADFMRATLGAWGEADERDFTESLDQLVAEGVADADRLVVAGYSYGGFMAAWLSARSDLFRAAVAGGLVCDHHGMTASSDMGGYLRELELGTDPDAVERLAATTYVDGVTAPTLILHGQEDMRCPVAQAELWYSLLRARGVETQMAIYPGGSHMFFLDGPLSHREDFNTRIVDWAVRHTA